MAAATTIIAGASLALTAGTTGMSFAQANKQKKLRQQAEEDAQKAMQEARRKLEVNVYDELAIPKEAYELEREAALSAGAQAIEAGRESQRGAVAVAGRIQEGVNRAQAAVRTDMASKLEDYALRSAMEQSRLRDIGVQLDLGEVAGAQLAQRDAQEAQAAYIQQGFEGLTSLGQQAVQMMPLYFKNTGAQKEAVSQVKLTPEEAAAYQDPNIIGPPSLSPLQNAGEMSNKQFRETMRSLSPDQLRIILNNQSFKDYTPNPFYF